MEELKDIIRELKKIREHESLKYDDNMLLDCATRIFNSHHIEKRNEIQHETGATDKQIALLKKLDVENAEKLSKREAYRIIKERLPKNE